MNSHNQFHNHLSRDVVLRRDQHERRNAGIFAVITICPELVEEQSLATKPLLNILIGTFTLCVLHHRLH